MVMMMGSRASFVTGVVLWARLGAGSV